MQNSFGRVEQLFTDPVKDIFYDPTVEMFAETLPLTVEQTGIYPGINPGEVEVVQPDIIREPYRPAEPILPEPDHQDPADQDPADQADTQIVVLPKTGAEDQPTVSKNTLLIIAVIAVIIFRKDIFGTT